MRIITRRRLAEWSARFPDAAEALEGWAGLVEAGRWNSIVDVRRVFPSADAVTVDSGGSVTVFNIRGNRYRLVVALHYRGQRAYPLRFLTHAEYDTDRWKRQL